MSELKKALRNLIDNNEEMYSIICTVTAIDKDLKTVDVQPINDSAMIYDVRLSSDPNCTYVIYPTMNSNVIVSFLDKSNAYVSSFSNVDLFEIVTENESLKKIL
jgi:hypothetical protein